MQELIPCLLCLFFKLLPVFLGPMQQSSHNTHSIISPGLLHCCLLRFCQLKLLFFSWVVMIMCIHSIVFQFCKTQQWFTDQKLSRPYRLYNFWKLLVQGYWNWYYQMSHTQLNTVVRSWDNLTLGQLEFTNTTYYRVQERPNKWHIFEKRIFQGYQQLYAHVSNVNIQNYTT